MRVIVLKLLCWFCVATTTNIVAYQNTNSNSKSAYIEEEWKKKFHTKDYSSNRYASLMRSSTSRSTTYQPPWYNTKLETTKPPGHYSYSYINSNNNNPVRLRHSRYPNLDGVLTRLDELHTTTTLPTTTTPPLKSYHRFQTSKTNNDNLFYDNYDEDNDDLFDYDDEDFDEDSSEIDGIFGSDEDDDDMLENEDEDETEGWQAEEATEAPRSSSLTDLKWQHYGTRSRVEESRRQQNYPDHSTSYAEFHAASEHVSRMNKENRCRDPLPRVLSVQNLHPDPGKKYLPHCTVLHRCAEDTGCCPTHSTKCAPKKQTKVYLHFYITVIGKSGTIVEKLPFYNHTECACLNKSFEPILDVSTSEENHEITRSYRSHSSNQGGTVSLFSSPAPIRKCKCPKEYISKSHHGTTCSCDCAEDNRDCVLIKRGKEYFSLKDRQCISHNECGYPACEYGAYIRNIGRCPRKQEKFDAFASITAKIN